MAVVNEPHQQPRALRRRDHQIVGSIISDAFADDPISLWVFGNDRGMAPYFRLAARKLYLSRGYGHVVANDGCTLWLPSGVRKHIPLWNRLDIAAAMIRHSGFGSLARGAALEASLQARHPVDPHHYLFAIGTRTASQGQGIGGRLMAAGLARVDATHLPVYLESSKESNVPFYRNFGFEVIERLQPTSSCPPMWLMWRTARR